MRRADDRVKMQGYQLVQLEHPSYNFHLLLQTAPNTTQGGVNKVDRLRVSPSWKSGVRA